MRKKIYSILALGAALLMASCSLHDDKEYFDTPAAQRVEESVAADKALLESASNGWELHLWTGQNYTSGGYTYFMKFQNGKVTVAGDIAAPDYTTTSSYDILSDQGPVLSVDTYNEIFHYLAEPSMDDDDGQQQDYEFVILRTTNDSIYLRGKKWGNHMVMTRVADGVSWADEISKMQAAEDNFMLTFILRNGTDSVGTVELNSDERIMSVEKDGDYEDIPYYVSTDGIVLQHALKVGNDSTKTFAYNAETMNFTSTDSNAPSLSLQVDLPDNYMRFGEFAGDYYLYYYQGGEWRTLDVSLKPSDDGSHYTLTGVGDGITMTLNYDKASGTLFWPAQQVGTDPESGNRIYSLAWSLANGGYFYFSLAYGLTLSHDLSQTDGFWLGLSDETSPYGIDSFILCEFSGTPSNSTYVGTSKNIVFGTGSYGLRYASYLEKK